MKKIVLFASVLSFIACGSSKNAIDENIDQAVKYASTITAKDLGAHLFTYASDDFEGRNTGEPGQKNLRNTCSWEPEDYPDDKNLRKTWSFKPEDKLVN